MAADVCGSCNNLHWWNVVGYGRVHGVNLDLILFKNCKVIQLRRSSVVHLGRCKQGVWDHFLQVGECVRVWKYQIST